METSLTGTYVRNTLLTGACAAMLSMAFGQVEWTTPKPLNSYAEVDTEIDDSRINLATDGDGNAVTVWLSHPYGSEASAKVITATSSDFGQIWSSSSVIFQGDFNGQKLLTAGVTYAGNGTWVSAWVVNRPDTGPDHLQDIYASKSTDNGQTWSVPQTVVSENVYDFNSRSEINHETGFNKFDMDIASDAAGTIIATFESRLLKSTDYGQTWSSHVSPATTHKFWTSTEPERDLESKINYCGNGQWIHAYARKASLVEVYASSLYVSRSSDNGTTWTPAARIAGVETFYNFNRFLGDLAADGNNALIAYRASATGSNYRLSTALSTDAGASWSAPVETPAAVSQTTAISLASKFGRTIILTDYDGIIRSGISNDYGNTWVGLPHIGSNPNANDGLPDVVAGSDGSFLTMFEINGPPQDLRADRHILSARILSNAENWTTSQYLNLHDAAQYVQLWDRSGGMAAGDDGRVVAAWKAIDTDPNTFYEPNPNVKKYMVFAVSSDYGRTWGETKVMHPDFQAYREYGSKVEVLYNGSGRWIAYWSNAVITAAALSTDNGNTWRISGNLDSVTNFKILAENGNGTMIATSSGGSLRSDDAGMTWHAAGASYGKAAVYNSAANWLKIDGSDAYLSSDNAFNWVKMGSPGAITTDDEIAFKSNGETILAAIKHNNCPGIELCTGPLYVARTTDNGANWTDFTIPGVSALNDLQLEWVDGQTWAMVWRKWDRSPLAAHVSMSYDDGLSWTDPELVSAVAVIGRPMMAAADGRVVIAGESGNVFPSEFDTDIFYINNVMPPQASAADWQLFE